LDKFQRLATLDFWECIALLALIRNKRKKALESGRGNQYEYKIIIEDPGLNKPTFVPPGMSYPIALKKAQDVGRNKENAFLIIEYCKRNQIPFATLRPSAPKWKAKAFKKLTGYQGTTNEHNRDAARLVWKL